MTLDPDDVEIPEGLLTTAAGYRRAAQRLAQAEAVYQAVVASNSEAAGAGDSSVWHDNFAYEENQRQMHQWARRARDLRALLQRLRLVETPAAPERVSVGCGVEVQDGEQGERDRYVLGGWDDGDPSCRRVAYNSPVGRALFGAEVGDHRMLRGRGTSREVTVVAIWAAREDGA